MGEVNQSIVYSYNRQIASLESNINGYNQRIRELENDIAELENAKAYLDGMKSSLVSSVASAKTRQSSLSSLAAIPGAIMKASFFSQRMDDYVSGDRFRAAERNIDNSLGKIDSQINASRREIEELRHQISVSYSNINGLNLQRDRYIRQALSAE